MLAAVACGEYPTVEAAAKTIVKVVDTIEPDPELTEKYEKKYRQFVKNLSGGKGIVSEASIIKTKMQRLCCGRRGKF